MDAQIASSLVDKDGKLTGLGRLDSTLNLIFTIAFTCELVFNAFANWFKRFFANGWNLLDVLIVGMSLVDLGISNIPDWLVKLMRAFRVIRLFGRINALKKMITAVTASIIPMMNAFVILLIILSICEPPPNAARSQQPAHSRLLPSVFSFFPEHLPWAWRSPMRDRPFLYKSLSFNSCPSLPLPSSPTPHGGRSDAGVAAAGRRTGGHAPAAER